MISRDEAIAQHEAAHVVAAVVLGLRFTGATLEGEDHASPAGAVVLDEDQPLDADVVVACLAGLAASEDPLGSDSEALAPERQMARRDVEKANALVAGIAGGDTDRAEALFLELVERAEDLLDAHSALWQRVTRALLAQRTLDRSDVLRLAREEQDRRR